MNCYVFAMFRKAGGPGLPSSNPQSEIHKRVLIVLAKNHAAYTDVSQWARDGSSPLTMSKKAFWSRSVMGPRFPVPT